MSRPRQQSPAVLWVRGVLSHLATRAALSLAIIVSLLPFQWVARLDAVFLLMFSLEFLARGVLLFRAELHAEAVVRETEGGWTRPRPIDLSLLGLDLVALISFVPIVPAEAGATRWLRLFRLTRMLMLLKYWAPIARDLWSVLIRRERLRQVLLMGAVVITLSFAGAVILDHATHHLAVDFDGDGRTHPAGGDGSFWVRLWWAFRQIQDPGNMLETPSEALVLAVSVALTVFGLFLVSFLIGIGTDVVRELMELSRLRAPGLSDHTVVVHITPATRQLLFELIRHYRKLVAEGTRLFSASGVREALRNAWRRRKFLVVGHTPDPPDFLREPEFAHIVYRATSLDDADEILLERADIGSARRVLIFGDGEADDPDDETIRLLLTVVERLPSNKPEVRRRKLIAEIFDESNVLAARKAIESARGRLQAHIVPTERLLALFTACVVRRPGLDELLEELLTSKGHELYTYDYRHEAWGSRPREPPTRLGSPAHALDQLHARAMTRAATEHLLPVGTLVERGAAEARHVDVHINPAAGETVEGRFAGFVAVAPNFRVVSDFADALVEAPALAAFEHPLVSIEGCPALVRATTTDLRRVLVCGFRPATVNSVEALMTGDVGVEILVLVADARARAEAFDHFDAHTRMVERGIHRRRGSFVAGTDESLGYLARGADAPVGKLWVEIGDWTSSRQLMRLPRGFGSVAEVGAVVLISGRDAGADGRTTTALMKIEGMIDHERERTHAGAGPGRIVAEVRDAELAQRLRRRYVHLQRGQVQVFSIQQLRAYFMFQAVVVPHFELVYGELMAPWGQSLVQLVPASPGHGRCRFADLAMLLRARGQLLIAIQVRTASGLRMSVGEGDLDDGEAIDLSRLHGVWVIDEDHPAGVEAGVGVDA